MAAAAATTNKAIVLYEPRELRIEYPPIEAPGKGEVQVMIKAVGLCGSDQHYFEYGQNGPFKKDRTKPLVLGHEGAGVVVAVGEGVEGLKKGDVVALEVGVPCGDKEGCKQCKRGTYNLCPKGTFRSSAKTGPPYCQGLLQEFVNHPAKWCHRMPGKLPVKAAYILGALLEPLAVGLHAFNIATNGGVDSVEDADVLVLGAGPVGLLTAAVLRAKGARSIIIADVVGARLNFAKNNKFADDFVILPRGSAADATGEKDFDGARRNVRLLEGISKKTELFDYVFECTGADVCVQTSLLAIALGGRVVLVGIPRRPALPLSDFWGREGKIFTVFRYANTYKQGIELLKDDNSKLPDISKVVTHLSNGLDSVPKQFEKGGNTSGENQSGKKVEFDLKKMIKINRNEKDE